MSPQWYTGVEVGDELVNSPRSPPPLVADYELEDLAIPGADLYLITSDNVAFLVRKAVLEAHSRYFSDILSQRCIVKAAFNINGHLSSVPAVPLDFPAGMIRPLLMHFSPRHNYDKGPSLSEILDVFEISHKYNIKLLLDSMRDKLRLRLHMPDEIGMLEVIVVYGRASRVYDQLILNSAREAMSRWTGEWSARRGKGHDEWEITDDDTGEVLCLQMSDRAAADLLILK